MAPSPWLSGCKLSNAWRDRLAVSLRPGRSTRMAEQRTQRLASLSARPDRYRDLALLAAADGLDPATPP